MTLQHVLYLTSLWNPNDTVYPFIVFYSLNDLLLLRMHFLNLEMKTTLQHYMFMLQCPQVNSVCDQQ